MSDMKIVNLKNGATLIYQHQNLNKTTQAVIGFKTGSRCDGDYKGLTHLIEHLWFAGNNKYSDSEMFKFAKTTNTKHGAATTYKYVYTTLDCVTENFDKMLEYNTEAMLNKEFTKERIDQEIEVINEEILLTHSTNTTLDKALGYMKKEYNAEDIVGTKDILLQITPEIIKEYSDKYFVAENLIASVVTDLSLDEVLEKFNNSKIAELPSNKVNEVPFITPTAYENSDSYFMSYAYGTENVTLNLIVPAKYINSLEYLQEIDYDILRQIDNIKFSDFSGKLYQKTRIEKQLAYSSYFSSTTNDDTIISIFSAETSSAKLNDCILTLADVIREAHTEGVTEQDFNDVIEMYKCQLSREYNKEIECGDAQFNVNTILDNEFIYPTQVILNRIEAMGREYYDKLYKDLYNQNNLTLCVYGDFNPFILPTINQIKEWAFTDNPERSLINYQSVIEDEETRNNLADFLYYYASCNGLIQEEPKKTKLSDKIKTKLKFKTNKYKNENECIDENMEQ